MLTENESRPFFLTTRHNVPVFDAYLKIGLYGIPEKREKNRNNITPFKYICQIILHIYLYICKFLTIPEECKI